MNPSYEPIHFSKDIPMNFIVHSTGFVQNHWHDALEVLFILDGSADIVCQGKKTTLVKEDLFVICPNQVHTISSDKKNVIFLLQISASFISTHIGQNYTLNSNVEEDVKIQLKKLIAEIVWVNNKKASFFAMKQRALLFDIMFLLARHFLTVQHSDNVEKFKQNERIDALLQFIQEHFKEDLSLQMLSETFHMTPAYVSRFFTNTIGISYKHYLTNLRLDLAVKQLIETDQTILEVALNSGFPNAKALSTEFKRIYCGTIHEYRKKHQQNKDLSNEIKRPNTNYTELKNHDYFSTLFKYLDLQRPDLISSRPIAKTSTHTVDLNEAPLFSVSPYWKEIMCIGRAKDLLRVDLQTQLRMVQREIGFSSVRFHGIFDDQMMVYAEDAEGHVTLNFDYIDAVIDFLRSIELEPFIEIGFMPKALAKNQTPYFHAPCYPSPPKQLSKWTFLLEQFFIHLLARYPKDEVLSWKFEFWNEPELLNVFWKGTDDEFLHFYAASYHTIKGVCKEIQIGGPSTSQVSDMVDWLDQYFDFCTTHHCKPDFFTLHFYPHDEEKEQLAHDLFTGKHLPRISPNQNLLHDCLTNVLTYVKQHGYEQSSVYITEWNASANHRELIHDTLYKSAYLAKNIVANFNTVAGLGCWTMSDIIEELPPAVHTFHGGIGLITKENIKKAGYHTYVLLNKLGTKVLAQEENFILTKNEQDDYQLLLFNYCHLDEIYCNNDRSMISHHNRYNVFANNEPITISLDLQSVGHKEVTLTTYKISKTHGSSYDAWLNMGHPHPLSTEEISVLQDNTISYHVQHRDISDTLNIEQTLEPHEVVLITIKGR